MKLLNLINRWTILGALGIASTLCLLIYVWALWTQPPGPTPFSLANAAVTVVPAPTSTPTPQPTQTPTAAEELTPDANGIVMNGYVQITGTEGEGLRLRDAPGLQSKPVFLGYDSEVFQIQDGPRFLDGFTWYYLVAPYDEGRAGWAAATYLAYIPTP